MNDVTSYLFKKLKLQVTFCCSLMAIVLITALVFYFDTEVLAKAPKERLEIKLHPIETIYDVSQLANTVENDAVKYGYELFINTPKFIGPNNGNQNNVYAGNRLACNNCHLQAGTKLYAAPLIGILNRFPQYRGREDRIGTIEERINGCMERSMNGKVLPIKGNEMKAFVSYLEWLSRLAPEDGNIKGQGFVSIHIPNRKVDLQNGKQIFKSTCVECHGMNGEGEMKSDLLTYKYPPLWGADSYNNGAGMNRVITAAQFIKANMPFGTTYEAPLLTDEEAYDVAGFINQQKRPLKLNSEKDFPDLLKKPVSTPYPPYVDSFPIHQHQLGPFLPILEFYKREYNIIKSK
jgi:thiosulfate dehydrogenase